ncbi:hypothetical protein, partial [Treponema pallidum]|uniref:hypothetical protein n=1 Tax=Treponema pallidum TaxID=160 RepID=UPI00158C24D4
VHAHKAASKPCAQRVSADLFTQEELIGAEIASLNPDSITPLEALTLIARWKRSLRGSATQQSSAMTKRKG